MDTALEINDGLSVSSLGNTMFDLANLQADLKSHILANELVTMGIIDAPQDKSINCFIDQTALLSNSYSTILRFLGRQSRLSIAMLATSQTDNQQETQHP